MNDPSDISVNDPVFRSALALRNSQIMSDMLAAAWQQSGMEAPRDLKIRVLQTHFRPLVRARFTFEAEFQLDSKPGKRLTQLLFVQTYPTLEDQRRRVACAQKKHYLKCYGPPLIAIDEYNAVCWSLPNGPQLRPFKVLLRPRLFKRFIKQLQLAPKGFKLNGTRPALIRYVPRKRALVRYRDERLEHPGLYFKAYGPGQDQIAAANLLLLRDAMPKLEFVVPRLLRHVVQRRVIVMDEVPGAPITQHLVSRRLSNVVEHVGSALASLHDSKIEPSNKWSAEQEYRAVRTAMSDVLCCMPELRPNLDAILRRLHHQLKEISLAETAPVHGNLFGDQILLDGSKVGIVDWDDLCLGDPLYDLGRLIAHIVFVAHASSCPSSDVAPMLETMVAAYQARRLVQLDIDRLCWHIAAALLVRSKIAALRQIAPGWRQTIADSIGEADRVLRGRCQWLPERFRAVKVQLHERSENYV